MQNTSNSEGNAHSGNSATAGDDATVRVVIVDDSTLLRNRIADTLAALEGVEIVGQAGDITAGAQMLTDRVPDVLVLDIDLPGKSGLELLETARRQNADLVIIMFTNLDHLRLRQRCAELGANFYFHKLTEFERAVDVFQNLAARRRNARDNGPTPEPGKTQKPQARSGAASNESREPGINSDFVPDRVDQTIDGRITAAEPMAGEKLNIIIVDQQPAAEQWVSLELQKEGIGFCAKQVVTRAEFLTVLGNFAPDLIIGDYSFADCPGLLLLAEARRECPEVPLIFVSSNPHEQAALEALRGGATDYVPKHRIERLGPAIRRALREIEAREHRRLAGSALREMEERYRALFDRSFECLFVIDFNGRFIDANPAALAMLGYKREEIGTVTFHSMVAPEHIATVHEVLEGIARTGSQREPLELRLKHKNGGTVFVETMASLILHEGKPFAIQGIARDITARKKVEETLRRTEEMFRGIVEDQTEMISRWKPDGTRTFVNQAYCRFAGKTAAEIVGTSFFPLVPEEYRDSFRRKIQNLSPGAPVSTDEHRIVSPRGETRWVEWTDRAQFDSAGNLVEVQSVGRDITERKQAEEEIRSNSERFRELAENITEVYWITDAEKNRMVYVSPKYETIWGRTCESLYGSPRTWLDAVHPDDRERVFQCALHKQTQGKYDEEFRIIRPDGSVRWIRDKAFPVRNEAGEVHRIVGVAADITERKNIEERIREQARLLDLAHDAIMVCDLDDNILYWNESAGRLYGWPHEEALGSKAPELLHQNTSISAEIREAVLAKDEWSGELTHLTKTGNKVLVQGRMTLVRDRAGNPKSILAINTDITERKKLEAQFLRAQRMESIGTLAGGIAHDLNNVLLPIMMSCQLFESCTSDAHRKQVLELISASAQRGANLVKQVLSFARGVEGRRMEIQIRSVIREVNQIASETFPKSIRFESAIARDLWPIVADPTQIHQVLLNLCVNARDAMPAGGVLSISAENTMLDEGSEAAPGNTRQRPHVLIAVRDTGTGIPPEIRDRIFDPFFTTKEVGKGSGLGLSTTMAIVKSHGGFINVYSESGNGSVFKVYLPAISGTSSAVVRIDEAQLPRGNGEMILVVDDEASVRIITKQTLQAFGYNVLTASDGVEAVTIYARNAREIAVVLTDMMMPVMDGPAMIHALRRIDAKVKVVATSGLSAESHMSKAPTETVKAFLPKPYTARTLLKTLSDVLTSGPAANRSSTPARKKSNS